MNKKVFVIFLLGLFILPLILNFISSQNESLNIFGITSESGVKLTEKWEYLGTEWKNILMNNIVVKAIDSFFQKLNVVFLVVFGVEYSLSVAFFLTVVLWVLLFLTFHNILGNAIFSKLVSSVISFALVILIAQTKLFRFPVNWIIGLFFGEKPWWLKLIIGVVIFAIIAIIFILIKNFGKQLAANKKKVKEETDRLKLHTGARAGEELSKAVGKS